MRVAGIDIGTNTIRLLVADASVAGIDEVERRSTVVGLGRGLEARGRLAADSLERAAEALEGYAEAIDRTRPDSVRVVATSATRDASNSEELTAVVRRTIGVEPDVIGGSEEAALSFAGAVWRSSEPGPHLVIDPGGGSTEFVFGQEAPEYSSSIDIGSVRLTDRHLPDRPATPDQMAAARHHVAELFSTLRLPGEPATVLGVAGTYRALAAIHLSLPGYDRAATHGVRLALGELDALTDRIAALGLAETEALPGLPPGRALVILAGSVVAAEAVRASGRGEVVVLSAGLLHGIVRTAAGLV